MPEWHQLDSSSTMSEQQESEPWRKNFNVNLVFDQTIKNIYTITVQTIKDSGGGGVYIHVDRSVKTGSIPDVWRTAKVSAIYKKGEKFKASNYRLVSLTCISFKMFEHIIVSNIMRHLDTNNILTDCQHGFRPRRSCETQLITLVDELVKSLNKGKQHDLAILDFSKAFDRGPHERLLRKLDHHGIRGKNSGLDKSVPYR